MHLFHYHFNKKKVAKLYNRQTRSHSPKYFITFNSICSSVLLVILSYETLILYHLITLSEIYLCLTSFLALYLPLLCLTLINCFNGLLLFKSQSKIICKFSVYFNAIAYFWLSFQLVIELKITLNPRENKYVYSIMLCNIIIDLWLVYARLLDFKELLYIAVGINSFIANVIVPLLIETYFPPNRIYIYYGFIILTLGYGYCLERRIKLIFEFGYLAQINKEKEKHLISKDTTGILFIKKNKITYINAVIYTLIIKHSKILVKMRLEKSFTILNAVEIINTNFNEFIYELIGKSLKTNSRKYKKEHDATRILSILRKKYTKLNSPNAIIRIGYIQNDNNLFSYTVLYQYVHEDNSFKFIFQSSNNERQKLSLLKNDSMFVSKIAHDFKNPLISMNELIELISKNTLTPLSESHISNFNLIKSFTLYLFTLAKDMECYTEFINKKEIQLSLTKVNIDETIKFTQHIANGLIARKNIINELTFEVIIDCFLPKMVYTDQTRLRQILINLISNSIKFTDKGNIILHLSEEHDALKFSVSDTGRGLNYNQMKSVFCPFEKLNENNKNGAGLGLCVVRELSLSIGQMVQFTTLLNHGSTFWFKIPLMNNEGSYITNKQEFECERRLLHLSINKNQNTKSCTTSSIERQFGKVSNHSSDKTIAAPFQSFCFNHNALYDLQSEYGLCLNQKNILVADEEELVRKSSIRTINIYAQKNNLLIETIEAADGFEVLNYLCKNPTKKIDLILCNEDMKYCHGRECYDALTKLFDENKINKIPFVFLSGNILQNQSPYVKTYIKPLNEHILHSEMSDTL